MKRIRQIKKTMKSKPVIEGAGVRLKRVFGNPEVPLFDPFLLMDDFHSENPEDYMAGFPMHPHRGIETITYMLQGAVEHQDSMGNRGVIQAGDIQWMTAGSGIIHEEMPKESKSGLWGFQLWANLPAASKMMPPRYQEVLAKDVPVVTPKAGVTVKVICGQVLEAKGPVRDIVTDPQYLDFSVLAQTTYEYDVPSGHTVFAYVVSGEAFFGEEEHMGSCEEVLLFGEGDTVKIRTSDAAVRFLLISGKPIKEPVAWYGPMVMNSQAEIQTALQEFRNGTFIKSGRSVGQEDRLDRQKRER